MLRIRIATPGSTSWIRWVATAAELRHGDVEHSNVRRGRLHLLHGFKPIGSFGNDGQPGLCFEQQPQTAAHDDMVVGQNNTNGITYALLPTSGVVS